MNDTETTIYIARHGQTDWNVQERIQGHSDIPLNQRGEGQATELGQRLSDINFAAIYSSDLIRAHRTAELIIAERQLHIATTKALRERNFGALEGKHGHEYPETFDRYVALAEAERKSYRLAEGAESDNELTGRLITFLREIALAHSGQNVLVVSHGGAMRYLLMHLGYAPFEELWKPGLFGNTSYIKLRSDGIEFFIDEIVNPTQNQ